MYGVFNRGLLKLRGLDAFLGGPVASGLLRLPAGLSATVGWGRSPYARRAERVGRAQGIPFLRLEDGFLRSVGLGRDEPPLSLVVDDLGIYYDAESPSRLELHVAGDLTPDRRRRADALAAAWRRARVSKYNYGRAFVPPAEVPASDPSLPYVLVVDQTAGDASIRYGRGSAQAFGRMLEAALAENPECRVLLKVHPEVVAGYKKGHFALEQLARHERIRVLADEVHPASLIELARAVYVVTSQMGFEALLWGKRVRTFGMPFYAGWGLSDDDLPAPPRRRPVPIENLIHGALIDYPRYLDPETGERCEVERLLDWMGLQRRMRERFPETVVALGFSRWKQPIVRRFLQGSEVCFAEPSRPDRTASLHVVWGHKAAPADRSLTEGRLLRIEDGFLRSVGLGADLVQPLSWVMDRRGIYYDSSAPSDLEQLLQAGDFDAATVARAQALRERLVATGVTKYNVGARSWQRPGTSSSAPGRVGGPAQRVILVPGQVESDASLAYGAPGVRQNLDLLRQVRAANPTAYVLYKPHPDVAAGLREPGHNEALAAEYCDEVVTNVGMGQLLPQVDEVHTLTSLTGFEALLRGKPVVCYGQPFYSGWGLTTDLLPPERRTRRLSLDELVAGVLIVYPTYVSRTTGRFTTAERALDELLLWRQEKSVLRPLGQRMIGRLFRKK